MQYTSQSVHRRQRPPFNLLHTLRDALFTGIGVSLAAWILPGLDYGGDTTTLLFVVLLLGVLNALLRPLLIVMALPFVIFTLGLGLLVINALLLWLASGVIPGFLVTDFWNALGGACIIGFVNGFLLLLTGTSRVQVQRPHHRRSRRTPGQRVQRDPDDKVIDI